MSIKEQDKKKIIKSKNFIVSRSCKRNSFTKINDDLNIMTHDNSFFFFEQHSRTSEGYVQIFDNKLFFFFRFRMQWNFLLQNSFETQKGTVHAS